eukprot:21216-Chlamydomonas_euryale.AAC.22
MLRPSGAGPGSTPSRWPGAAPGSPCTAPAWSCRRRPGARMRWGTPGCTERPPSAPGRRQCSRT